MSIKISLEHETDTEDVTSGIKHRCEHHLCVSLLNLSLNHIHSLHTHAVSPCCRLLLSSPSSILCWHVERVQEVCVRVWVS